VFSKTCKLIPELGNEREIVNAFKLATQVHYKS